MTSLLSLLLLLAAMLVALDGSVVSSQDPAADPLTGQLCIIFYSKPGNVEYPWSVAISLNVQYNASSVPNAVNLISGTGTRVYSNKYNTQFYRPITLAPAGTGYANNRLYTNGTAFDYGGIVYTLPMPYQFPGRGGAASAYVSQANFYRDSYYGLVEDPSFIIDNRSVSVTSNIPGFQSVNLVGCPNNPNCANTNTTACTSRITASNGYVPLPTNEELEAAYTPFYNYSYFISDGQTWSTTANLTLGILINPRRGVPEATLLGDYYLDVINVTGTRVYNNPLNSPIVSSLATNATMNGSGVLADQYLYCFTQLQQPSVYSNNSAPFFDFGGLGYSLNIPTYRDGQNGNSIPPTKYASIGVYVSGTESYAGLVERQTTISPNPQLQQQTLQQQAV